LSIRIDNNRLDAWPIEVRLGPNAILSRIGCRRERECDYGDNAQEGVEHGKAMSSLYSWVAVSRLPMLQQAKRAAQAGGLSNTG
jgi:hypothetical protein